MSLERGGSWRCSAPRAWGEPRPAGVLRAVPEDFVVEEDLGFAPDGDGAHLLLKVRKRNANTGWVAQELARALGCAVRDVGFAGLKDRRAIAIQWFSLPATPRALAAAGGLQTNRNSRCSKSIAIGASSHAARWPAMPSPSASATTADHPGSCASAASGWCVWVYRTILAPSASGTMPAICGGCSRKAGPTPRRGAGPVRTASYCRRRAA